MGASRLRLHVEHLGVRTSTQDSTFSQVAIASGIIAFFFFPVIFGPLGIFLSAADLYRQVRLGWVGLFVSTAGLICGMIWGAMTAVNAYF